jgi:hypothetical protein
MCNPAASGAALCHPVQNLPPTVSKSNNKLLQLLVTKQHTLLRANMISSSTKLLQNTIVCFLDVELEPDLP